MIIIALLAFLFVILWACAFVYIIRKNREYTKDMSPEDKKAYYDTHGPTVQNYSPGPGAAHEIGNPYRHIYRK